MRVTVNGEPRELPDAITIAGLVTQLELRERRIAVEVNCDIIPREQYDARTLREGDTVEIVHFIGGG
jgi:thiamine biosynthesis protein ThiS